MSGDYNINVNLNADVVGSDDVKALAKEIRDLLVGAEKGAKGVGSEAQKTTKHLKDTKTEANSLKGAFSDLAGLAKAAAASWVAVKLGQYIMEATTLAARYETLGAVMTNVGRNAGYSSGQMAVFEERLKSTGISAIKSRDALTMMAGAQMDLSKSAQLARVAQDAAVIGGINSSEAFERMVQGIRSGQIETLRTIGINVNFQRSYNELAKSLGKSADALTNNEKTIARQNAVMEEGEKLAGAYAASMETAGKQASSMDRYIEDLQVSSGEVFLPAYSESVKLLTESLKESSEWVLDNRVELEDMGQALREVVSALGSLLNALGASTGKLDESLGVLESFTIVIRGVGFTIALLSDLIQTLVGDIAYLAGWIDKLTGAGDEMLEWGKKTINSANALDKFLDKVEEGQGKVERMKRQMSMLAEAEAAVAKASEAHAKFASVLAGIEATPNGKVTSKQRELLAELQLAKEILEYRRDSIKAGKLDEEIDGPPTPAVGSGDDAKKAAEKAAADRAKRAKLEVDLTKAKHDALVRIAKNAVDAKQRDLDEGFRKQEISIKEYYDKRTALLLEVVAAERKAKEAEITAQNKIPVKAGEQLARDAQKIKQQSDLNDLKARESAIIEDNKLKSAAATREFLANIASIRIQLSELQGQRDESSINAEVESKFKAIRDQAAKNLDIVPDGVQLVDKLIDVEKAKANLAELQKVYNDTLNALAIKEEQINSKANSGTNPGQIYSELAAAHKETSAALDILIPQMEAYATLIGDEATKNAVATMKLGVVGIKETVTDLGAAVDSGVTSDVKSLFDDISEGSKDAGQAVEDFGRNLLRTFMDIINKQLAMQLMSSLFGGASGSGGTSAGFWSSVMGSVTKKKDGGSIRGPGTSTSDSIPALLSDGEYVIRASAAKRLGVGFLDLMNGVASRPRFNRFADGGPAMSSISPSTSSGDGGGRGDVKVVNMFDPSMLDEVLKTRKGEKAILNVIEANPQFVKALIR